MKITKLVKDLNDICSELDKTYRVNYGGCCFLAYEISRHLDKLHIKYDLQIYSQIFKDIDEVEQEIRHKSLNSTLEKSVTGNNTCEHYYLNILNGGYVNADNCTDDLYTIKCINHTHLLWIYKNGVWNDDYDIKNNRKIRKVINSYFYERKFEN